MGSSLSAANQQNDARQRRNSNKSNFSRTFSSRKRRSLEELGQIDKKLDQINTSMGDFDRIRDSQLYSDIHSRIINIVEELQHLKRTFKDSNELEKVRFLELRSKEYLHRLLQHEYLYERNHLDTAAVESNSFIAAQFNPTTNKIKSLQNSLERKQPASAQDRLEQIERNIPLIEKEIEKAMQLQQHNQFIVIEKKLVLHEKDLNAVLIKSNKRLQRRKDYLAVGLQKLKAKISNTKTDLKKIEHAFRKISSLEGEIEKFTKTKVDESYKVIEKTLQDIDNEIRSITTDFQYIAVKRGEILEKIKMLTITLNKIAEQNEQAEIKEQILELRKLEDQLRNIQVQLVDLSEDESSIDHYVNLRNDLVLLYESLNKIHGMGAHMQHKQVMMQVIQNILQQLSEKIQNRDITHDKDDQDGFKLCESLNNFEQLWEKILKQLKSGSSAKNDLHYTKTLLTNISDGILLILNELNNRNSLQATNKEETHIKVKSEGEKHLNDTTKRVSYVQMVAEKEGCGLNEEERNDLKKALTNYGMCLKEMKSSQPEELEELQSKITTTVQKLDSKEDNQSKATDKNDLKQLIEQVQKLKRKVENFKGSYRNTLYVTIENDLNECLMQTHEIECSSDEKLQNATTQLSRKINQYLRILEERSTKNFEVIVSDSEQTPDKRINEISKEIEKLHREVNKFYGTNKNDSTYMLISDSYKRLEDELHQKDYSDMREECLKAIRKSLTMMDSRLQQNYLKLINDSEKYATMEKIPDIGIQACVGNDPIKELDDIEKSLEKLKKQVDEFAGTKDDEKFTELDEKLIETFVRLDKIRVSDNKNLRERKKGIVKEVQKYDKMLEEKINKTQKE